MSSVTGAGVKEFFDAVEASRGEYERQAPAALSLAVTPLTRILRDYLPELQRARASHEQSLKALKEDSLSRFMKDLSVDREKNPAGAAADRWDPSAEENEDDDDDVDVNIVDRSESPLPRHLKAIGRFCGERRALTLVSARTIRRGCLAWTVH